MNTLRRYSMTAAVLALIIAAPLTHADNKLPVAKPDQVGLSKERLARIADVIKQDIAEGELAGASAMIIRNGHIAYSENFGYADREKKKPIADDTIYRIYSMSKPITSVGLMMLYEEGRFSLDDPVSLYLPELGDLRVAVDTTDETGPSFNIPENDPTGKPAPANIDTNIETVPSNRDMSIRDLMRHTAGLTYGFFGNTDVDQMYQKMGILLTDKSLDDFTKKLGKLPLLYQPGERWHYSVSVDVQGRLIEVLSGQTFDVFLKERIFDPLGMADTGFYAPADKLARLSQLYSPAKNGKGIEPALPFISRNFTAKPALFSGGGGLVSTTMDYARFAQMLANGGELDGVRIISRKTLELMTKDHCQDAQIDMRAGGSTFGLGFGIVEDQGLSGQLVSEGSYSWGGAAGTLFWVDPEENLVGLYMMQTLGPQKPFNRKYQQMVYQAIND